MRRLLQPRRSRLLDQRQQAPRHRHRRRRRWPPPHFHHWLHRSPLPPAASTFAAGWEESYYPAHDAAVAGARRLGWTRLDNVPAAFPAGARVEPASAARSRLEPVAPAVAAALCGLWRVRAAECKVCVRHIGYSEEFMRCIGWCFLL